MFILLRPSEVGVPSAGDSRGLSDSSGVIPVIMAYFAMGAFCNQFNTAMEETTKSNRRAAVVTIKTTDEKLSQVSEICISPCLEVAGCIEDSEFRFCLGWRLIFKAKVWCVF